MKKFRVISKEFGYPIKSFDTEREAREFASKVSTKVYVCEYINGVLTEI